MRLWAAGRRLLREERGISAVEFALTVSILFLVLAGCFEAGRVILLNQKLDRAASVVGDLVAQAELVSEAMLDDIYFAAGEQTRPFDFTGNGHVIVSSVYRAPAEADAMVVWQRQSVGGPTVYSTLGVEGDVAGMPVAFSVDEGENVIVAEVFYDYVPFIFAGVFDDHVFRHSMFTRPRAALLTVPPT